MSKQTEIESLKDRAEQARGLFVEEAAYAMAKSYDEEVSAVRSASALRWLQIADGLENIARRKHAELCGVEV